MPFMQDKTYLPMNFATLGPSWLQPPFTEVSILSLSLFLFTFQHRAGVRSYTSSYDLAGSCVFNKQSLPPIQCHLLTILLFIQFFIIYYGFLIININELHKADRSSLSQSYRVILPSSFNIVISSALVYSTYPHSICLGYGKLIDARKKELLDLSQDFLLVISRNGPLIIFYPYHKILKLICICH